jgi:hypothetical protein
VQDYIRKILTAEQREAINSHFGVDLSSLKPIGVPRVQRGPYKIDDFSVLKITSDETEYEAVRAIINNDLSTDPGISVVLPKDVIRVGHDQHTGQDWFAYRTELLVTGAYRGSEFSKIAYRGGLASKLENVRYILYETTEFFEDPPGAEDPLHASDYFMKRCEVNGFDKDPHVSNIIFFLYQALTVGILLSDVKLGNSGFRFDKKTGEIDEEAGLVAFDLELML